MRTLLLALILLHMMLANCTLNNIERQLQRIQQSNQSP